MEEIIRKWWEKVDVMHNNLFTLWGCGMMQDENWEGEMSQYSCLMHFTQKWLYGTTHTHGAWMFGSKLPHCSWSFQIIKASIKRAIPFQGTFLLWYFYSDIKRRMWNLTKYFSIMNMNDLSHLVHCTTPSRCLLGTQKDANISVVGF